MEDSRHSALPCGAAELSAGKQARRTYVLIHGAWHGGWVWRKVADGLRAMGHTVYTPSLTGLGDRRHLLRPAINLDTHADDIVNLVEMEGLEHLVLVGWSYGGFVASDVLARISGKVASVVYLDAFAPERGRSLLSYSQRATSIDDAVCLAAEGKDIPPLPLDWMGVTDSAVISYVTPRLSPHPVLTYLQPSKALTERPEIPHTFVLATKSQIVAFKPFLKVFDDLPNGHTHVVDADHLLMLTAPETTLRILAAAP
jgi:pimeloyl-ACP methyl ester carboxylesterase